MNSIPLEAHECGPTGPSDLGTVAVECLAESAGQPQVLMTGGRMLQRRTVGLDLGIATDHTAVVLDETGTQLARIYWVQMVERGATHTKALAVVATHLARRLWRLMLDQRRYVVCDLDGRPVDKPAATAIIAERYTVPEDIRRRRRSKKVGKAPHQVLEGHVNKSARSAHTRRPSPPAIVAAAGT